MSKKSKRIPPVRYVTLFPGRTGTTWLVSHMQTHPEVVARYEILSRHNTSWPEQKACLDELFEQKRYPVVKAVGFKTKIHAIDDWDSFSEYLHRGKFRIIHQVRENKLKFIVSVVRAKMLRNAEGQSNLFHKDQQAVGPIEIPETLFARAKKRLNVARQLQEYIDTLQLPILKITYEALLHNEQSVLDQVWDFLDVSRKPTQGLTRKNTPDDVRRAVTNLDELLAHHPEMAQYVDQD